MTENNAQGRNRRSLLNIRFMKGARLRLLFGAMTAGMIVSSLMLVNVMSTVNTSLRAAQVTDPSLQNLLEQIGSAVYRVLAMGLVLSLTSAVIALLFGFLVSHRFYGPIVPLTRHLGELRDGRYGNRARLRPGDELTELMEAQNALAEALEKRYGAEKG